MGRGLCGESSLAEGLGLKGAKASDFKIFRCSSRKTLF